MEKCKALTGSAVKGLINQYAMLCNVTVACHFVGYSQLCHVRAVSSSEGIFTGFNEALDTAEQGFTWSGTFVHVRRQYCGQLSGYDSFFTGNNMDHRIVFLLEMHR